jgi:hypothetical protein
VAARARRIAYEKQSAEAQLAALRAEQADDDEAVLYALLTII